jgi:hypothetical protein
LITKALGDWWYSKAATRHIHHVVTPTPAKLITTGPVIMQRGIAVHVKLFMV